MKKNKNVDDDNNIIYLSIADCVISEAESIASDIFNAQTIKLLAQKKG